MLNTIVSEEFPNRYKKLPNVFLSSDLPIRTDFLIKPYNPIMSTHQFQFPSPLLNNLITSSIGSVIISKFSGTVHPELTFKITLFLLAVEIFLSSCASTTLIQSNPNGAKVYIDGEAVGQFPSHAVH